MDIVDWTESRALNLEVEQLASAANDRERLLRTHLRLAVCHLGLGETEACDARLAAFEAMAAELRAPWYGVVGGHAARRARDDARDASPTPSAWRPPRATPARAAGHEAVERIWITNRESRLRAADRHDDMLAWEPEGAALARDHPHRGGLAGDGLGADVRAAGAARPRRACTLELLPESFRPPDGNVFALFFVGEAVASGGTPELARSSTNRSALSLANA